jgi:hypothetical protein
MKLGFSEVPSQQRRQQQQQQMQTIRLPVFQPVTL